MNRLSKYFLSFAAIAGLIVVPLAGTAFASTTSTPSSFVNNNHANSNIIPRSTLRSQRLIAESEVLKTSTASVQAAHKDHTFKKLLAASGLTRKQFSLKVAAQLKSNLEAMGYSADQIIITRQHHEIMHYRHEERHEKGRS